MKKGFIFGFMIFLLSFTAFSYVQLTGIDSSNFPAVKLYVSSDEGVIVNVTDNAEEMTFSAEKLSSLKHSVVDLVFVFDTTGSMKDEINSLYRGIDAFTSNLKATGIDYNIALITFGDSVRKIHNFTSNVDEFKDWLRVLNPEDGSDKKEASLDAMKTALSLSYREGSQKILILITDAAPHEREDGTDISSITKPEIINALKSFGMCVFALSPYNFETIARNVGGIWKDIEKNRDFSKVLDLIESIIVEEYMIEYLVKDLTPELLHEVSIKSEEICTGEYLSPESGEVIVTATKIISTGIGAVPEQFIGEPWGFVSAREAAIMDAQKRMLEIMKGVSLRGGETMQDGILTDRRMTTAVLGWLKGAYIIEEEYLPKVSLYKVKIALDMVGENGLLTILRDLDSYKEIGTTLESGIKLTTLQNGWVKATGFGIINSYDSKGEAIYKARTAALADAQARLLEIIKGAYIESNVQIENMLTSNEISKTFEGILKGAEVVIEEIVAESVYEIEGLYRIEMGVPLTDRTGIMGILINKFGIPENQKVTDIDFSELTKTPVKEFEEAEEKPAYYTGVVIDTTGMELIEAIQPRILNSNNEIIYSCETLDKNYLGAVFNYCPSITVAKNINVGTNPLIIDAESVNGCDIVLSDESVEILKEALKENNFFKRGRVSVIL